MQTFFLILRLLNDLELHSMMKEGSQEDHIAKINAWAHSEKGMKILGDIDQILEAKGIDLQIAVTKR